MPGTSNGPTPKSAAAEQRLPFDPEDPEYVRDLQRPAVIKEDLNEMERRRRVRQILESRAFREELEQLITAEKQRGTDVDDLQALEQLSELILPKSQLSHSNLHGLASQAVNPIADMRGAEAAKYGKTERLLRSKLASLYRLVDLFHWSQGIYNHITLRLTQELEHVLINPFGLLYHEISASSLVKVDIQGNVIDQGSTTLGINSAGYVLHSAIHQARPDLRCVIHLHTPVVGAVAAMKCGLLPISQEAMIVGPVSYHDFHGIVSDEERESIARDLGPNNKVMLLRNHGFVACGHTLEEAFHLAYTLILACETQVLFLPTHGFVVGGESVEEAFYLLTHLVNACEAQVRAARAGIDNLNIPSPEAQRRAFETAKGGGGGVNKTPERGGVKWRVGELEWEAWMRVLDNAGFRTGHLYRQPLLKSKATVPQSDVEVPPASTAFGLIDDVDGLSPAKLAELRKAQEKVRWLNTPNAYQKVETLETGTADPKKITKWVPDTTSPVHGTAVKIDSTHQFSPIAVNTKEFKNKQKEIKQTRLAGNVTAGPQSHILEGTTWEEAARLKDAQVSGAGDHVVVVGAASKGIIQRQHQHNAQIYRQLYQPNPFANETDEGIEAYKREVERKLKGDTETGRPLGSPVHESGGQSPDSCSLMQIKPEGGVHDGGLTQETTFDANTDKATTRYTEKKQVPASDFFRRAKSERFYKKHDSRQPDADQKAATDDEGTVVSEESPKKKEKKKKFKTPSFLKRKKDKDKKKNKAGAEEEEEE